jgi:hypothetical protein
MKTRKLTAFPLALITAAVPALEAEPKKHAHDTDQRDRPAEYGAQLTSASTAIASAPVVTVPGLKPLP